MLLLVSDVSPNVGNVRLADAECTVSVLPAEPAGVVVFSKPFRGVRFDQSGALRHRSLLVQLDEEVHMIVDTSAFKKMSFLRMKNSRNVGKEDIAKLSREERPPFFRTENDVNVKACK